MEEYGIGGADDDFFYEDLKRWILSLMMDEEEEEGNGSEEDRRSPSSTDGFSKEISKYGSSCLSPNVHGVPLLIAEDPNMLNIWSFGWLNRKESGGTGVFIPHSSKHRRKPKAKRKNHRA